MSEKLKKQQNFYKRKKRIFEQCENLVSNAVVLSVRVKIETSKNSKIKDFPVHFGPTHKNVRYEPSAKKVALSCEKMIIENFDTSLREVKLQVHQGNDKVLQKHFVSTKKTETWEIPHFTEQNQNETDDEPFQDQSENTEQNLYEFLSPGQKVLMNILLKMPPWVTKLYDKRII